ncbi:hypothetical protein DAPPUDRAFT_109741 [Daphnia pulex]|uniref:Uncharacterized protein n=1 Tax=Daphnia pulex TaxID=6669 RepID=E9H421_DAPPU|nr:hypothetical protein DAPPUDRAFT_109741 [Daphnia pulex]|eukprot:EFX73440.1 hypothetical protein DAPPUDRAFT_109741 [Daphnia pulex]
MGVVNQIIDPLVIVSAKKGCPAIDLNSKIIWQNIFGAACTLLNKAFRLEWNMEVYFASQTHHTAFVEGSDASWDNDQEPPEGCLDYSDDEQERRAKAANRLKKNLRGDAEE